jgi:transposase
LRLLTRRFFCRNPRCPRAIFAERHPTLAAPHAQRTAALDAALGHLGLALGGRGGAGLGATLGLPASASTVLRLLHTQPAPEGRAPRVVGVDEWAWKRGRSYGTILVDLERHRVADLLPDRSADAVAAWFTSHPGVEVVSRDRGGLYAEGTRRGAPEAIQVADRFHLLRNLVEALERCLLRHGAARRRAAAALDTPAPARPRTPWQRRAEATSLQRHAPKVTRYERVWSLHARGYDLAHIARTVGVSRPTVYRYLSMDRPPERKRPRRTRPGVLDPYRAYLMHRWGEGCHNASQLTREIRAMGYAHSGRAVAHFILTLRQQAPPGRSPGEVPAYSARHLAFLLIADPGTLTADEGAYLAALEQAEPALAEARALAYDFAQLLRRREGERLDRWLERAGASGSAEVRGFATGLRADLAAVRAGLTLAWSNGQTEGQVHRLKLLKRQMYGRAGFALLRTRVLAAA